jgi:hypothetical protein
VELLARDRDRASDLLKRTHTSLRRYYEWSSPAIGRHTRSGLSDVPASTETVLAATFGNATDTLEDVPVSDRVRRRESRDLKRARTGGRRR